MKEYIRTKINEMEAFLTQIEKKHNVYLKGERKYLYDPFYDCHSMTEKEIDSYFEEWKELVLERYKGKEAS